jgi:hypothetical protein
MRHTGTHTELCAASSGRSFMRPGGCGVVRASGGFSYLAKQPGCGLKNPD